MPELIEGIEFIEALVRVSFKFKQIFEQIYDVVAESISAYLQKAKYEIFRV